MLKHLFYWNDNIIYAELDYNLTGQIVFRLGGISFQ